MTREFVESYPWDFDSNFKLMNSFRSYPIKIFFRLVLQNFPCRLIHGEKTRSHSHQADCAAMELTPSICCFHKFHSVHVKMQ